MVRGRGHFGRCGHDYSDGDFIALMADRVTFAVPQTGLHFFKVLCELRLVNASVLIRL